MGQQPLPQHDAVEKKVQSESRDLKLDLSTVGFCLVALFRKIVVRFLTFFPRLWILKHKNSRKTHDFGSKICEKSNVSFEDSQERLAVLLQPLQGQAVSWQPSMQGGIPLPLHLGRPSRLGPAGGPSA